MNVELRLRLPPGVAAVAAARGALAGVLDYLPAGVGEDLRLLVSELVTNSILHAGLEPADLVTLTVTLQYGAVTVEVHDPGCGFVPPKGLPEPDVLSGRGLYLVSRLARRWGTVRNGGMRVWFELDASGTPRAEDPEATRAERMRAPSGS